MLKIVRTPVKSSRNQIIQKDCRWTTPGTRRSDWKDYGMRVSHKLNFSINLKMKERKGKGKIISLTRRRIF